ncbi:MAG: hypothetical protein ACI4FY_09195 [Acetatifactor sp.]
MEGSRTFNCYESTSLFGRRNKNAEVLFLKVENGVLSGRGYVCNEEGKNGYVDDFSFKISEVSSARIDKYNGTDALFFKARIANLYGAKKCQIALPQMRSAEEAVALITNLKRSSGGDAEETIAAPVVPVPPAPKAAEPVVSDDPAPRTKSVAELRMEAARQQEKVADSAKAAKPAKESVVIPEEKPVPETFAPMTPEAPGPVTPAASSNNGRMSTDEFNKRMEKLTVLKDCGLLGEKEFKVKKTELVSEYCDLTEFNEKIQKMIILKECGVLSEKEFEANRRDIIKECCDFDTPNLDEFSQNIQKLSFLQMGEVITDEEYNAYRDTLIENMDISVTDDVEAFRMKLRKLPVLRDSQFISDTEYKKTINKLFKNMEVSPDDPLEEWAAKLEKWPILAEEHYLNLGELRLKQKELCDKCLSIDWEGNLDQLTILIQRMLTLRDCEWLSQTEFYTRKTDLIRKIDSITDYSKKLQARMILPKLGLITEADYENWKQRSLAEILAPCADMSEFKSKANNLMELQNAGVITEKEFTDYKMKLMNDL